MIQLPHGCYCTGIAGDPKKGTPDELPVHPQNWRSSKASLKKKWYIQYRYYDPENKVGKFKDGKLRIIKTGINTFKTLTGRQKAVRHLMETELYLLKTERYNPITNRIMSAEHVYDVDPRTPLVQALQFALENLDGVKGTKQDAKSVLKYVGLAALEIGYSRLPVCEVSKKHIKILLEYMKRKDPSFSDKKFNRYRSNLYMLFSILEDVEAVQHNPCEKVKRKKVIKRKRITLTPEERKTVSEYLLKHNPDFHRFVHIFYHSGGRETELVSLQGKDVDLHSQVYTAIVKKGIEYREVERTIKNIALPLWQHAMQSCGPEDYLFSKGLRPGPVKIDASQINRRWKRWVKDKLGITADFYSLKHSNTTETVDKVFEQIKEAQKVAAEQNAHTTGKMVATVYDIKSKERMHEELKEVSNDF